MNIIAGLSLSIAILVVAIAQYKITRTNIDKFKDLYDEIEKLKEQLENDYMDKDGIGFKFDEYNRTVKGKAEYAIHVAEFLTERFELLEKYFGLELKITPAKPSKIEYKPIKKGK